jgi:predicted dehydrogenase
MTLRAGLLGCGRIAGYFHGPILARLPGVAVTALADPVAENRRRLAYAAPAANHYADWQSPIELGEIDLAVICLPPALHARAAVAAFEAGCHVYVEKPLALTRSEGRAMIAAWERAGTVGMVGLNFRFHPLVEEARRRVADGELGAVTAVRTLFTSQRRSLPDWKAEPGAGGDALADLGTHDVDLAAFLTGRPVRPESLRHTGLTGPSGSAATVSGTLADGTLLSLTVAQTTGTSERRIEILGEKGHLQLDLSEARLRMRTGRDGRLARLSRIGRGLSALSPAALLGRQAPEPSFARALRAFVTAAQTGQQARPDLHDGFRAMELVLAAAGRAGPAAPPERTAAE